MHEHTRSCPSSEFVDQLRVDHPGLTQDEAKVVAETMLRCAELAAKLGSNSLKRKPKE